MTDNEKRFAENYKRVALASNSDLAVLSHCVAQYVFRSLAVMAQGSALSILDSGALSQGELMGPDSSPGLTKTDTYGDRNNP